MHRTFIGNLQESLALIGAERTFQCYVAVNAIDHAFLGLAIETILGVNPVMRQPH
jgi:hypothetical protein